MSANNIPTIENRNAEGFIIFANRNFSRRGDKGTWARYDSRTGMLIVNKAGKGLISEEFTAEMEAFCAQYGIDFRAMSCGTRQSVNFS